MSASRYPGERVRIGWMIRGYSQARERYESESQGTGIESPYYALFEALNWAVAIDDVIQEIWVPERQKLGRGWRMRVPGTEILPAVRLVRNLVHHRWAHGLRMVTPAGRRGWLWPASSTLPPPVTRWGAQAVPLYDQRLAGASVSDTLHTVGAIYAQVGKFLGVH